MQTQSFLTLSINVSNGKIYNKRKTNKHETRRKQNAINREREAKLSTEHRQFICQVMRSNGQCPAFVHRHETVKFCTHKRSHGWQHVLMDCLR